MGGMMRFVNRLVDGASSMVMRRTVAAFVHRVRCYSLCFVGQLGAVRFFFLPHWFDGLGLECSHVWSHSWVSPHIGFGSLLRTGREFCSLLRMGREFCSLLRIDRYFCGH